MKRIALVFLVAILLPAILLAVLAVRSVRDQELIVNSQRAAVYQSACDSRAAGINLFLDDVRIFYGRLVDEFVESREEADFPRFHEEIRSGWSQAAVGAVVTEGGRILAPVPGKGDQPAREFLANHSDFLTNQRVVEVYEAPQILNSQIQVVAQDKETPGMEEESAMSDRGGAGAEPVPGSKRAAVNWRVEASQNKLQEFRFEKQQRSAPSSREPAAEESSAEGAPLPVAVSPDVSHDTLAEPSSSAVKETPSDDRQMDLAVSQQGEVQMAQQPRGRVVAPSRYALSPGWNSAEPPPGQGEELSNYSQLSVDNVRFNDLSEFGREGAVSRIIDGELHVLLWKRPESEPDKVFWVELDMKQIEQDLEPLFSVPTGGVASLGTIPEMSLALLNSRGELVTQTEKGFSTDWERPFVAAEVGQILPRWEVAAYFLDPDAVSEAAKTFRLLLVWLVGLSLLAVAAGSFLIFRSVNYEMRMAARKTDFVSNVSHELKTPLTSIRMFSDLLSRGDEPDAERTRQYSGVISRESARLSRLIHRLLDFSRLERGELKLNRDSLDLVRLVPETVEQYRPHLLSEGIELHVDPGDSERVLVEGDSDAVSQVLWNLLSNAEKYAAKGKEILVELVRGDEGIAVHVHDRGPGIPRGMQKKIFEKFYRVDESIDSGIEGSGIGLALSRQIMVKLGGALLYEPRTGGGSTFTLRFPPMPS